METTMTTNADTFHDLHRGPDVLLLANCWDAGSARLLESLGAKAVATTSAGLAWAQGYPDGDVLPVERLAAVIAAIVRVINVPLSVDMEAGYSDDPVAVGKAVGAIADAGAVGINIEDGASSADLLATKIEHARRAADKAGVRLFINARTDVYLRGLVPEGERVAETLSRARRWRDAGADGFFVPKVVEENALREIAASAGLPLNVLAWPELPPASRLAELGVRRLSAGSSIAQAAWGRARERTRAFLADGRSDGMFEGAMLYPEINALFAKR
jgi:2-methylisocitrate lyase-like PEP mutase family enzyme